MSGFAERADLSLSCLTHKAHFGRTQKGVIDSRFRTSTDAHRLGADGIFDATTHAGHRRPHVVVGTGHEHACRACAWAVFWDVPLANIEQTELLARRMDLLTDIMWLPQQAVMRRIMGGLSRSVKYAYIILRKQLPYT
jgi:hypothetical protein